MFKLGLNRILVTALIVMTLVVGAIEAAAVGLQAHLASTFRSGDFHIIAQ